MDMTEKKPPPRIWAILVWLALIIGMIWLVIPLMASSQTLSEKTQTPVEIAPPPPRTSTDPFQLYPDGLEFDVYREGSRVGKHKVAFKRDGDQLIVETELRLKVKILFITVYKFVFESTGVWKDGVLQTMKVDINDNGNKSKVDAYSDDDGKFYSTGRKGDFVANAWVYPTNHWNSGVVDSKVVLNTLDGVVGEVDILRRGIETVDTAAGSVVAEKFDYTGLVKDTTVWYDSAGHWVKMVSTTKAGETIEYHCNKCGVVKSQEQAAAKDF